MKTFQACERRHYYGYGLDLGLKDESDAVNLGHKGHRYLEDFFKRIRDGMPKQKAMDKLHPAEGQMGLQDITAVMLARKYAENFPIDGGQALFVEDALLHDLTDEIQVAYLPDLVWQFESGKIQIKDWKFVSRAWALARIQMDDQLPTYKRYMNVAGYPVKTVSNVFFNTRDESSYSYKEFPFVPTDEECLAIENNQIEIARKLYVRKHMDIDVQEATATLALDGAICERCPFRTPCQLQRKGVNETSTLEAMYKKRTHVIKKV